MAKINQKGEVVVELRCEQCQKFCGALVYPRTAVINEEKILAEHRTLCDEHKEESVTL